MMNNTENVVLIANEASLFLGQSIAERLSLPFTEMEKKRFADGEWYHAFPFPVAKRDLVIIGSTHNNDSFQELLDLIAGARFWNARSINVIIPFLGYSTMERAKPGSVEIPKGITRTRQIFRARPDYVGFVDLHSEAVLHAHAGEIDVEHIWTDSLATEAINSLKIDEYVLVSPDYGFSKRVARLASILNCSHTAADKDRYDTDKTIVSQVSSVVRGKTAIICDDMIRTGGSIIQTAERCMEAGAKAVLAYVTHLVLAEDAEKRFAKSPVKFIIGTDSYPERKSTETVKVFSLAPLLAEIIGDHLRI